MPQLQLPIFQEGVTLITPELGYARKDGRVTYLHGMLPVFSHEVTDTASFKMIVSQFYVNGAAKQVEIVDAFGINALALKRWVKTYREDGPQAFFVERRGRATSKKKAPTIGSEQASAGTRSDNKERAQPRRCERIDGGGNNGSAVACSGCSWKD